MLNRIFKWLLQVRDLSMPVYSYVDTQRSYIGALKKEIDLHDDLHIQRQHLESAYKDHIQTLIQALEDQKEISEEALQGWRESINREEELRLICEGLVEDLERLSSN